MRCTSFSYASPVTAFPYDDCDRRGTIVAPLWPPTTVTGVSIGLALDIPARKRAARTTSRVVTPKRRAGSNTPAFSRVEATMGTVELTGFDMTRMCAVGATRATEAARSRTIDALVYIKRLDGIQIRLLEYCSR